MKHVVITPAKDEEKYIVQLMQSVINQTYRPTQWIIVDDGSNDMTYQIAKDYANNHNWITVVKQPKKENRASGAKVIRAFKFGMEYIKNDYNFITKLDADLILPQNYFKEILDEFQSESKLGICGGVIEYIHKNKKVIEKANSYHVRGALKTVRKECFAEINGFQEILGWDGLDEMSAMSKGWQTYSINVPVFHHRPTRSTYNPIVIQYRLGYSAYKRRNNFILAFLRSVHKFRIQPIILCGISYFIGYISAFLKREPSQVDDELARYINKFHLNRILKFKKG